MEWNNGNTFEHNVRVPTQPSVAVNIQQPSGIAFPLLE